MGAAGIVYQSAADNTALVAAVPSVGASFSGSGDSDGFALAAERGLAARDLAAGCGLRNCKLSFRRPGEARAADIERLKARFRSGASRIKLRQKHSNMLE
jgi:hypothetical protein